MCYLLVVNTIQGVGYTLLAARVIQDVPYPPASRVWSVVSKSYSKWQTVAREVGPSLFLHFFIERTLVASLTDAMYYLLVVNTMQFFIECALAASLADAMCYTLIG